MDFVRLAEQIGLGQEVSLWSTRRSQPSRLAPRPVAHAWLRAPLRRAARPQQTSAPLPRARRAPRAPDSPGRRAVQGAARLDSAPSARPLRARTETFCARDGRRRRLRPPARQRVRARCCAAPRSPQPSLRRHLTAPPAAARPRRRPSSSSAAAASAARSAPAPPPSPPPRPTITRRSKTLTSSSAASTGTGSRAASRPRSPRAPPTSPPSPSSSPFIFSSFTASTTARCAPPSACGCRRARPARARSPRRRCGGRAPRRRAPPARSARRTCSRSPRTWPSRRCARWVVWVGVWAWVWGLGFREGCCLFWGGFAVRSTRQRLATLNRPPTHSRRPPRRCTSRSRRPRSSRRAASPRASWATRTPRSARRPGPRSSRGWSACRRRPRASAARATSPSGRSRPP
jgi:hypothetical protein